MEGLSEPSGQRWCVPETGAVRVAGSGMVLLLEDGGASVLSRGLGRCSLGRPSTHTPTDRCRNGGLASLQTSTREPKSRRAAGRCSALAVLGERETAVAPEERQPRPRCSRCFVWSRWHPSSVGCCGRDGPEPPEPERSVRHIRYRVAGTVVPGPAALAEPAARGSV